MTPQIKQRIEQIRRGEIPEGYKKTKVGIVPEEWEEGFLGNYIQEYKELSNDIEKYPVYSSSRQGLIPQSLYFDNREAVETNLGYKIVPNGYVTYRHMSDDDLFHFNVNNTGGEILVSSEYPVFSSTKKSSLGYIIPMLNDTARFRYFCRTQKMGGTRTRLYYKNLCNYKSVFPPLAEQEKIVEILQAQDKLIELQQKKIDELKRLKKGYLSKMFPKKGCNVPEIRFPGFTDAWEQRKLSEITDKVTEKNAGLQYVETFTNSAEFGIISQRDFFDHDIAKLGSLDGYYIVKNEDFVYNPRISTSAPVGPINRNKLGRTGVMSPLYTVFRPHDIDTTYLEYFFKCGYWHSFMNFNGDSGARSDRFSIRDNVFFQMPISIPDIDEQRKIGELLTCLDNLITLHQRELEKLQSIKKALLEKMFV